MKKIHLTIPEPCHENWNNMKQVDKGRYCNACQKTLIDFTTMSDRDLVAFFKKPPDSVCGHFQHGQLNRDIIIPPKRIPWIKYFFQFAIPAFLFSQKSSAQGKIVVKDTTVCTPIRGQVANRVSEDPILKNISGNVTDENGKPLAGVSVMIKKSSLGTITDVNGNFQMKIPGRSTLVFSYVGYQTRELNTGTQDTLQIPMISMQPAITGAIVYVGFIVPKKPKHIPLITKLMDTAFSRFSVYPNPVASNATIRIKLLRQMKGPYQIEIFNNAGAMVMAKEIFVDNKKETISWELNNLPAGNYFVRMTNKATGKQLTEKIVVE